MWKSGFAEDSPNSSSLRRCGVGGGSGDRHGGAGAGDPLKEKNGRRKERCGRLQGVVVFLDGRFAWKGRGTLTPALSQRERERGAEGGFRGEDDWAGAVVEVAEEVAGDVVGVGGEVELIVAAGAFVGGEEFADDGVSRESSRR